MPFEDTPIFAERGPIAPGVANARSIDGGQLAGAALRNVSPVGSTLNSATTLLGVDSTPDPAFNGWEEIKDTKYAQHAGALARARNKAQLDVLKGQIDQEDRDNQIIADAGGAGIIASLAAGLIDPTILLPGGAIYRGAKGGFSVARTAGSAAMWGGVQGAASEAMLQGTQMTRKPEDWLMSIGSSAVLSGLLGGGAAALLSKGERVAMERAIDDLRGERGGGSGSLGAALNAAEVDVRTGRYTSFSGLEKVPVLGKMMERVSPTMRVGMSILQESRRVLGDLAVLSLDTVDNARGITTARGGISVEGEVMMARDKALYNALPEVDRLYQEYRFGPEGGSLVERGQNKIAGVLGRGTGFLSKDEFNEEIGKAMRRNDEHSLPQVQAAAQKIRKDIIEPLKERAIRAGLLPEDVKAVGAPSWWMRLYNREKIEANGPEFSIRVQQWLRDEEAEQQAIKERLSGLELQRQAVVDSITRLEGRLETSARRMQETETRLAERAMEVRSATKRADVVEDRAALLQQQITDIEEFIGAMRSELRDPKIQEQIARLEADLNEFKKQSKPMTLTDLEKIEREEVKGVMAGPVGDAVDIFIGRKKAPKEVTLLGYMQQHGVYDPDGEVSAILGGRNARPGFVRPQRNGNSLDEWGERFYGIAPWAFPNGRPSPAEVLNLMDASARGQQPAWLVHGKSEEISETVRYLDEVFRLAGVPEPRTRKDFARTLNEIEGRITLADLDRIDAEMDAAGARFAQGERVAAEGKLQGINETRLEARALIERAITDRGKTEAKGKVAGAVAREAGISEGRNLGRLGILQERAGLQEQAESILSDALAVAGRTRDDLLSRIEKEIGDWAGDTSKEARAAIKAREKYIADQSVASGQARAADAPRLTSADDAVARTVQRALSREARDDETLLSLAEEIKDRIISTPDGRMPYETGSSGGGGGFTQTDPMQRSGPRGSLAARDFAIPDALIEDFLDNNAERGIKSFLRTFLPDVALTEKFGSTDLTAQIKKIQDEANALEGAAKTEAGRRAIRDQAKADIGDLAAMRDRVRGVYGAQINAKMRGLGRAAQIARVYNQITSLGSAGISSLPDMAGVVIRWGLDATTSNGWGPYLQSLVSQGSVVKSQREQFRAMGIGIETWTAGRMQAMDAVSESYHPNTKFERGLDGASQGFFMLNLQSQVTDLSKHVAASVTSAAMLNIAKKVSAGTASEKEIAKLTAAGIDPGMAKRVWAGFSAPGAGEVIDGVHLPNLDKWGDAEAARRFEAALHREVNIAVITPGQEKPLWMSNPVLGLLGQFKSFAAGAHERLFLAGLQRADAHTLQGVLLMMSAGALSVAAGNIAADRPFPERPQDWVKESLERSGLLGWLSEVNQMTAKATSGQADMYRMIGADKPLSRNAATSAAGMFLGPTYGKVETLFKGTAGAFSEDGWTARDTQSFRQLLPLQNLWALRRGFNAAEDGLNRQMGVKPLDRDRLEW